MNARLLEFSGYGLVVAIAAGALTLAAGAALGLSWQTGALVFAGMLTARWAIARL